MTPRQALLLIAVAIIVALGVRARAAGMIVSPGSFMGLNTRPAGGSGPPAETFYLLTEGGDRITAENGDRIITQ